MSSSNYFPLTENLQLNGRIVSLSIDIAKQEDAKEISNFFMDHYYSVPLIHHLYGLYRDAEMVNRLQAADLEFLTESCLNQAYSLVIRERIRNGRENNSTAKDEPLLAVIIARMETREEYERNPEPFQCDESVLMLDIVNELHRGMNFFETFQTDRILHHGIVRPEFYSLGLATKLLKLSLGLAWMDGAGAVVGEALGENSRRACLKLGLETFRTLDYTTFLFQGSRPLADVDMGGHRAAYLVGRRLTDNDRLPNQPPANKSHL